MAAAEKEFDRRGHELVFGELAAAAVSTKVKYALQRVRGRGSFEVATCEHARDSKLKFCGGFQP
jgi:hypothetical protein